jgi:microcin C transport system ATP-binding protein
MLALQAKNLVVGARIDGATVPAIRALSFDLEPGKILGLVGESGAGKSMVGRAIAQLLPAGFAISSGSLLFEGEDLLRMAPGARRALLGRAIAFIPQAPMTSLNPVRTIGAQFDEHLARLGDGSRGTRRDRAVAMLTAARLPRAAELLTQYPHQLSGGMCQRVLIALAFSSNPRLVIADEPTTALDVTVQAQIIALLKELQQRLGMSLLFITHDLGIVRKIANRVCVMKEGKIVEHGDVERVFAKPEHPYTRALLAAEPKPDPAPLQPDAPMVLEATNLKIWFPITAGVLRKVVGHIKACDGVTIELHQGETLGVVGESGSGKSTLGRAILRLISSEGPIAFMGHELQGLRFKEMRPFRHDMQIVFQDPYGSLSPRLSVAEIIKEGLKVHHPKMSEHERDERVIQALKDVGLDPATRFRFPHEFSGGQRQRIAVARAIVLEPTFIVLDEPTSALDMVIQAQMVDLLRSLQKRRNLTYLFISHDLRVVAALASHLIVMRQGKVVEAGAAADLFKNPKSDYTRALFAAAFNLDTAPAGVVAQ